MTSTRFQRINIYMPIMTMMENFIYIPEIEMTMMENFIYIPEIGPFWILNFEFLESHSVPRIRKYTDVFQRA